MKIVQAVVDMAILMLAGAMVLMPLLWAASVWVLMVDAAIWWMVIGGVG